VDNLFSLREETRTSLLGAASKVVDLMTKQGLSQQHCLSLVTRAREFAVLTTNPASLAAQEILRNLLAGTLDSSPPTSSSSSSEAANSTVSIAESGMFSPLSRGKRLWDCVMKEEKTEDSESRKRVRSSP